MKRFDVTYIDYVTTGSTVVELVPSVVHTPTMVEALNRGKEFDHQKHHFVPFDAVDSLDSDYSAFGYAVINEPSFYNALSTMLTKLRFATEHHKEYRQAHPQDLNDILQDSYALLYDELTKAKDAGKPLPDLKALKGAMFKVLKMNYNAYAYVTRRELRSSSFDIVQDAEGSDINSVEQLMLQATKKAHHKKQKDYEAQFISADLVDKLDHYLSPEAKTQFIDLLGVAVDRKQRMSSAQQRFFYRVKKHIQTQVEAGTFKVLSTQAERTARKAQAGGQ